MNHAVHASLHGVHLPCMVDELHQEVLLLFLASASAAAHKQHISSPVLASTHKLQQKHVP